MREHIDPICGMSVAEDSPRRFAFDGETYYFCSDHCLKKFAADPGKYVKNRLDPGLRRDDGNREGVTPAGGPQLVGASNSGAQSSAFIYTCPMHPEIRQVGPGTCPKCGMALEPEMPSVDEGENPELVDFSRRFWWTLPLTAIVFLIAMFGHAFLPSISAATRNAIELILATPVVLWAGWPFFERCVASIRTRNPNMWTLIGVGVAAAYAYSVLATVAPGLFPKGFEAHGGLGVYFQAAAVIVSLTLMGQLLELRA